MWLFPTTLIDRDHIGETTGNERPRVVGGQASENNLALWGLRVVASVLVFVGLQFASAPWSAIADVVPFVGSLVGTATTVVSAVVAVFLCSRAAGVF